jgi:hypothetical protein
MSPRGRFPRMRDPVWIEGESQPNGLIVYIDYEDKQVKVAFYGGEQKWYSIEDKLDGNWNAHSFGGTWLIREDH